MSNPSPNGGFFTLALSARVVLPSLKIAAVVGTILAAINHGGTIMRMDMNAVSALQLVLTYIVPYCVSTYSAVRAIQSHET
ncbi:hypothetical protein NBRC116583_15950 [Arenicella sp. 4NH20-0111]|uniref:nitrate/nitrite transporter NrtS n=1 Tax=Arenicella sp. 4NH20-0111 TaxID=3127648 RepID=UPI00310B8BF3